MARVTIQLKTRNYKETLGLYISEKDAPVRGAKKRQPDMNDH